FERLREAIREQREETLKTVQYARDSLGCFDQRVNLLDERYRILRETAYLDAAAGENLRRGMFRTYDTENMRQLKQMASGEQTAKKLMEERIAFLDEQALAMESYLAALDQGSALFHAYSDFLNDAYDALKRRFLQNIIAPVAMLIVIVIVYLFISRIVLPALYSKDSLFVARRIGGYACFALALMMLSGFFLEDLKAIATVMGLVGAAVVIALQDLCSSFAGWFVIVAGRKIRVGDRVEIDGHRGEIIDIQILRTTLLELNNWLGCNEQTGRTMFIPNSFIFKSSIFNFSHIHPYINDKLNITVTFETDPQKAFDTLFRCLKDECKDEFEAAARGAQAMEKHYGGAHVSFEPHIHTVIADSGVCYSLFFVAHYRRVSSTRDRVMKRILAEFAADQSLQFAYPTLRNIPTPTGPLVISQPKV
ncbi:MAG: mechanosensitive ion channel, partial [Lentisphaerae bacterium]|nr:mechanosensitive ion channel [Lentisphaerota bacterium]